MCNFGENINILILSHAKSLFTLRSTPSYWMPLQVRGTLPNCPNYSDQSFLVVTMCYYTQYLKRCASVCGVDFLTED